MANNNSKPNLDLSDESKSFQERIDEIRTLVEENLRYTKNFKQGSAGGDLESQKELQELLKENLKISKDLYEMTKKINRWVSVQKVWGILKVLIILIPIVLGAIYLPPLIKQSFEPIQEMYQNFLGLNQEIKEQDALMQQVTDQLKDSGSLLDSLR